MAIRKDRTRDLVEDIETREVAIEVLKIGAQTPRTRQAIRSLKQEISAFATLLSWQRDNLEHTRQ
jgi:hypothetical protein